MDAIQGVIAVLEKIEGASAQWIVRAARHSVLPFRLFRAALDHVLGRCPAWPHNLAPDVGETGPAKTVAAHRTAEAQGLLTLKNQEELTRRCVDDDRPRPMAGGIGDDRA